MTPTIMGWLGRGIAALWAAWWSFFALAEARFGGAGLAESVPAFVFTACVWALALLPWKWPSAGWLLVIAGLFVAACYPLGLLNARRPDWVWFVLLTLALPAIIAGLLMMAGGGRKVAAGTA